MKFAALVLGLTVAVASPALAQTAAPTTAAPKHYTTAVTTIGTLLADPAAKAIVDKNIPGFSENPQVTIVADATLMQIQSMKPDVLSDKVLAAIDADLAKLPAK